MQTSLCPIDLPDFGEIRAKPEVRPTTYANRCEEAYRRSHCDWFVVYADREHFGNIVFLTGFEPRFEEALLLLGPNERRVLITGNECQSYATLAQLPDVAVLLAQSMSSVVREKTRLNLRPLLGWTTKETR